MKNEEVLMPTIVVMEQAPEELDLKDIEVKENECFNNAFRIAEKNPPVRIVEGVIVLCDNANNGTAKPHAWNELDGVHFDLTAQLVWPKGEATNINKVNYACVKFHTVEELQRNGVLEFCSETIEGVDYLNRGR